jgi:hypothetical protein
MAATWEKISTTRLERVGAVVLTGWVPCPRLPGPLEAAPCQIASDPAETTRKTPLNLGSPVCFAHSLSISTQKQASIESLSVWGQKEEKAAMHRFGDLGFTV